LTPNASSGEVCLNQLVKISGSVHEEWYEKLQKGKSMITVRLWVVKQIRAKKGTMRQNLTSILKKKQYKELLWLQALVQNIWSWKNIPRFR
jgi:hypothetical protein